MSDLGLCVIKGENMYMILSVFIYLYSITYYLVNNYS